MDLNPILAGLGGTPAPKTNAATEAMSGQMAVDTVVTIRDKVVEAYQEILRMPV